MPDLADRVALVTGAGSGIGRATALLLAREGAALVVTDLDEAAARATAAAIAAEGGRAAPLRADAAQPEDHQAAVDLALSRFGALHVAVNNAGVSPASRAPVAESDPADWDRVIAINLTGVYHGLRAQIPAILASGGGAIVNIASILGAVGRPNAASYVAAKHGVVGLTKSAALDYAPQNLRVNAIGPGFIRTPLIAHIEESDLVPLHPIGRLGLPEEVAQLVLFLASPRSAFMTGGYHPVDGGYLAQ